MKCYRCGGETRVLDTVDITTADRTYSVRRRRKCLQCNHQFHTSEILYRGPNHHTLTMDQVSAMRRMKTMYPEMTQKAIGEMYGVKQHTVSRILNRQRWPVMNGKDKTQ